jgi:hypothetical protein
LENNMAFVNEEVPPNAKRLYSFAGFVGPFGPMNPEDLNHDRWTIDHERNAFLLYTGGGGGHVDSPRREWYGLYWNGEAAHFAADQVITADGQGQLLTW